jgi:hypothetical protein
MGAVVSRTVEVLQRIEGAMHAGAWGKEVAEEDTASTEVVDTKVMGMLVLVAILFKVNQVGRQQVGILQALEMIIGGDRGITTTIRMVIIEQAMGVISRGGLIRTMVEGEVLFSHASGVLMKVWLLDQLMRNCSIRRFRQ